MTVKNVWTVIFSILRLQTKIRINKVLWKIIRILTQMILFKYFMQDFFDNSTMYYIVNHELFLIFKDLRATTTSWNWGSHFFPVKYLLTGATVAQVQRVHLLLLKFGNGCNAPVLKRFRVPCYYYIIIPYLKLKELILL